MSNVLELFLKTAFQNNSKKISVFTTYVFDLYNMNNFYSFDYI